MGNLLGRRTIIARHLAVGISIYAHYNVNQLNTVCSRRPLVWASAAANNGYEADVMDQT